MTRSTNRFIVGLALSVAAHGLLIAGVRPMTTAYPTPRSLQVELLDASPVSATPAMVSATSDFTAPSGAPLTTADPAKIERQQPNVGMEQVSGPDLRFTPDRYYSAGELDVRAEPVNEVPLVYPQLAYQNRMKGKVLLRIRINQYGGIDELVVLEAEPRGIFEEAALAATQPLRFSPAIKGGRPVKSQKIVEVAFDPYENINIP